MNEGVIAAIAIPLAFLLATAGILVFVYKSRVKRLDALVKIVELGGNVDPEMMNLLSQADRSSYKTDYRRGLIWLAIGGPFSLSLYITEGFSSALLGSISIFIGIAYLVSGKLRWREED